MLQDDCIWASDVLVFLSLKSTGAKANAILKVAHRHTQFIQSKGRGKICLYGNYCMSRQQERLFMFLYGMETG